MKTLILYYLSLKPTHGYEIQRFIDVQELNQWTKIQSGSIYYALSKLEKDGLIERTDKADTPDKSKKIYRITDSGRKKLDVLIRQMIAAPICDTGSNKFFMLPLFSYLNYEELEQEVSSHIRSLEQKKAYLMNWQKVKIDENSLKAEKLAFDMMIGQLDMQIQWHQAILKDYDKLVQNRELFDRLVALFHYDDAREVDPTRIQSKKELVDQAFGCHITL